jgi:dihydroorotate dehydrogenase electron transfer subunit
MTKGIVEAHIINHTEIADSIYRITLQGSSSITEAKPGQFINVYLRDKSMLLPRPISICRAEKDRITLVYRVAGKGTKELSAYREGDPLKISTPLGHGYDIDAIFEAFEAADSGTKTIALAAGGLGVPPMVELAKTIQRRVMKDKKSRLISLVGFQKEPFLIEELKSFCDEVHIAVENGAAGFRGNVLEMMEKQGIEADYYLSCGPRPMLKALAGYCDNNNKPLQVSLEERMGCGYGACVGCTCKTKEKNDGKVKLKKVCLDGPVFFGNEVIWNE